MYLELAHNVSPVRLRNLRSDPQNCCNFLADSALHQKLHSLTLPSGQGFAYQMRFCRQSWIAKSFEQDLRGAGGKK
jgi:hypothetical protein